MQSRHPGEFVDTIVRDYSWFPYDLDPSAGEFIFVRTDREEISQQVFLDPRWTPRSGETRRCNIELIVDELAPSERPPPLNIVWHTSLCCSTLLMKLIDFPGHNLALREPKVLVSLADALRAGLPKKGLLPRGAIAAAFALLARAENPNAQVTVKPSNFSNFLVREAARTCRGKTLFLYSDLPDFLLSLAKGGTQFFRYARQLFGNIAGDLGRPLPWSGSDLLRMTDLEIASLVWHLQIAEFRRSWPELGNGRAASLDCRTLLERPTETLLRLNEFFGLGFEESDIDAKTAGPLLSQHAKLPGRAFDRKVHQRELQDVRRQLGADLERTIEWSYRALPGTPRELPLPNPLVPIL